MLYPQGLPRLARIEPPRSAEDLVEWFWVPEWDLPEGVVSQQPVLAYPAANLVIECDGVALYGATTRMTERLLVGSGWAVGAVLRPIAFAALAAEPALLVDRSATIDAPELLASVVALMPGHPEEACARVSTWLDARVGPRTPDGRLANDAARLLMTDPSVLRVEDAASRLAVSVRSLQRRAHQTVGLSPAAIIRRRRLQEAAQRARDEPDVPLAQIAAELGYADQAHLANDFRSILGVAPSGYRQTSTDS